MNGNIQFGKISFAYEVIHAARKTLEIAVHPDRRVTVKAPLDTQQEEIEGRLKKRAGWVVRQLDYFRQFEPRMPSRNFVSGETHRYLGRQYRLKVIKSDVCQVKLHRGRLMVELSGDSSPSCVAGCLEDWYRGRAKDYFAERMAYCAQQFAWKGEALPRMQVKKMRLRWGSLSPMGTLTLNLALLQAPRECIDYVITHELCHLEFHDHSLGFYRLLEKVMPDWEKRKRKLELALI